MAEDANVTNTLLNNLSIHDEPRLVLHNMLSIRSVISTTFSFANRHQAAQADADLQKFRKIGQGSCGAVFEHIGFADIAKRENLHNTDLWNDFTKHIDVIDAINDTSGFLTNVRVPACHGFIRKADTKWWSNNRSQFPEEYQSPGNIILAERIPSLPQIVRHALIDLYFPPSQPQSRKEMAKDDPINKDCLARIYLGKRRDPDRRPSLFFTLVNFNLHLDQMEELRLETDFFAKEMAKALALLHWVAKIDADDVEFVLGSAPIHINIHAPTSEQVAKLPPNSSTLGSARFQRRSFHMWPLDFNRCSTISMDEEGVDAAVKAFYKNDPYYPRPLGRTAKDQQLWNVFRESYLESSDRFGQALLAEMFIRKVVERRQAQLEERGC